MKIHNGLATLIAILILGVGVFGGVAFTGGTNVVETEKIVIQEKLVDKECPACLCPEVLIPEIENADNFLLNEFLKIEFADEYNSIEVNATVFALEELEDDDYEVVVDYLMSLVEGVDEDKVDVDVDDTNVKVTKLGLEEDEDKSARVTFEVEVSYRLEEGVNTKFNKDLLVVYDVVFDEGDFNDEEVELVSIV